jgi:hypothetical protein
MNWYKSPLIAVTLVCALSLHATAKPYRPTDDQLVLLDLPAASRQASETTVLRQTLKTDPRNVEAAVALARSAINEGRRNGDPRLYGQAQAALAPWWTAKDAPLDIIVLRATINQAFHAFDRALADLDHVLTLDPQNLQARLSRSFIWMVTGNLGRAGEDCSAIVDARAALIREICSARLDALSGKGPAAFARLKEKLAAAPLANAASRGFAQTVLAEIAVGAGDTVAADELFRLLTSVEGPDVATLAAYADLLIAQGKYAQALTLLENQGEADALILRRALAAKKLNDPRLAQWSGILAERFEAAASSNNRVHLREEARFRLEVLDDAASALSLATENWSIQKEPADAELLLAVALASANSAAALPVQQFIAKTGLDDARLKPLMQRLSAP